MPLLAIGGFGFIAQMASTNTVVQTIVNEQLRGRVMAFYTMAFFGTVPVGSLIAGLMADAIGSAARYDSVASCACSRASGSPYAFHH